MSVPEALIGHWVHAHEEDHADTAAYRRRSWPLPPARGRSAFEIKADGEFVQHGPGPVDVSTSRTGRWRLVAPDRIAVTLPGERPYELLIASAAPELLEVRRV